MFNIDHLASDEGTITTISPKKFVGMLRRLESNGREVHSAQYAAREADEVGECRLLAVPDSPVSCLIYTPSCIVNRTKM